MQGHPRLHNEAQANVPYMTQCLKKANRKQKNTTHAPMSSQ